MKVTPQLKTRLLSNIEQIKDKVEAEFFIKLSSCASLCLADIIDDKKSNLIFYRKRKDIDEFKIYNGHKVIMSALLSIFFQINVFTDGLEDLNARLKKVLFDIFEFSDQDKKMTEDLIQLYIGHQKDGPNIGNPRWGMMVYACLVQALIFETYPIDRALTDVDINRYWGKDNREYIEDMMSFLVLHGHIADCYIYFQKNIPSDLFSNRKY